MLKVAVEPVVEPVEEVKNVWSQGLVRLGCNIWKRNYVQAKCGRIYHRLRVKNFQFCRTCAWSRICRQDATRETQEYVPQQPSRVCSSLAEQNTGSCWSKCHWSRSAQKNKRSNRERVEKFQEEKWDYFLLSRSLWSFCWQPSFYFSLQHVSEVTAR